MKKFKRATKMIIAALLAASLTVSATACSTDKGNDDSADDSQTEQPGGDDNGGGNNNNDNNDPEPIVPPDESEGIDWTKYWDGKNETGSSSDNFKFTSTKDIGSVDGDFTVVTPPAQEGEPVSVTFSDGVPSQSVTYGSYAVRPETPEINGKMFVNWYTDAAHQNKYDFYSPVTENLSLDALWADLPASIESVKGNKESLTVIFSGNASSSTVQYKLNGTSDWKGVDKELIRSESSSTARVDILGLPTGEYDVKINSVELPAPVFVDSYDRSGYAHFNRNKTEAAYNGVGAYKDDGSLKDDALVIYVTDENKDKVMDEVCANNANVPMFQIPGNDWNHKNASGIGWWLNNNQYTSSNIGSSKNKVPSNTYDANNGSNLAFKAVDRPIVIRFIGTVTTPEGCTSYNDTKEGGGVGDNGHMARMKNLKNVTLEGVGDDAAIKGWGFHYVIGTDAKDGRGTSFEVRNLTFTEYPEDAIGMEGQQEGSVITAPVERCWIHNNTFLPGYCANPAESDKAEGDGSCDFKRGQYYTCSYNYFEWCHKTNLIGSSDSSLQYNISMHHNMWYNCGSRVPLLRQSNCHFYNNYVCGDMTASSPYAHISKPALSYVHSLRANCYMFSEANYYEGSKNITDGKSGGSAKSWNDVYTACFGTNTMEAVTSREQKVSNACKYASTDYSSFDTDPSLFYYNAATKTTDALLDDAYSTRTRVLLDVGAQGFTPPVPMQKTVGTPQTPPNVELPKGGKAKGEIVVFSLAVATEVTVTTTSTGDVAPDLYDSYGRLWLQSFTDTRTIILPKGTYAVASGQKDKESVLTNISFVEGEGSSDARVAAVNAAFAAIPTTISISSEGVLKEAKAAYGTLVGDEATRIDSDLLARYAKALEAYDELLVEYVIARIDYIGEVSESSFNRINAAQIAYSQLTSDRQKKVTNYDKLTAAWDAYDGFAATNVINRMLDLPDLKNANVKSQEALDMLNTWFDAVQSAYDSLDANEEGTGQQGTVKAHNDGKTYAYFTENLNELKLIGDFLEFREKLAEANENDGSAGAALVTLYNGLSANYVSKLTTDEVNKFNAIKEAYLEFASQAVTSLFTGGQPTADVFKHTGSKQNAKKTGFVVHAYGEEEIASGLKFESSTELTLTIATKMTVSFYLYNSNALLVGDKTVEVTSVNGDNVATITLEAGSYTIKRAKSENSLYYAVLAPAN